jgi:hypothetical protein
LVTPPTCCKCRHSTGGSFSKKLKILITNNTGTGIHTLQVAYCTVPVGSFLKKCVGPTVGYTLVYLKDIRLHAYITG